MDSSSLVKLYVDDEDGVAETRAAVAAGTNSCSARTRGSRWLANRNIQAEIEELRKTEFKQIKEQAEVEIAQWIRVAIYTGRGMRRMERAMRLLGVGEAPKSAQ